MSVIKQRELLDDLAMEQNANPQSDLRTLFGTWPGDPDDGFEDLIRKRRQQDISMRFTND